MYKVKIVKLKEKSWIMKHAIGDIVEIDNATYRYSKDCFEIIEHYVIKTVSKTRCPCCDQWIIKREKVKL